MRLSSLRKPTTSSSFSSFSASFPLLLVAFLLGAAVFASLSLVSSIFESAGHSSMILTTTTATTPSPPTTTTSTTTIQKPVEENHNFLPRVEKLLGCTERTGCEVAMISLKRQRDEYNLLKQEQIIASNNNKNNTTTTRAATTKRCAVNFYGLPRSFKSLVLPSVVQNVIAPNVQRDCDYFVHYYNVSHEAPGRSGVGGPIHPEDIFLLRQAVLEAASNAGRSYIPKVEFSVDTDESFQQLRGNMAQYYMTKKVNDKPDGSPVFTPPGEPAVLVMNVMKMWHSQNRVWKLMEQHHNHGGGVYERVVMLRSDVVFLTPIDFYKVPATAAAAAEKNDNNASPAEDDLENQIAVIPGFAKWPVNDRAFWGPYEAVKIWAFDRFDRYEKLVMGRPGTKVHSETLVDMAILPAIKRIGLQVREDTNICFLRVRADGSVWLKDCGDPSGNRKILIEKIGLTCGPVTKHKNINPAGSLQTKCE